MHSVSAARLIFPLRWSLSSYHGVLGEEGKVDESSVLLKRQEELRAEKRRLEDEVRQREAATGGTHRQKLRVCEVCGGKLSLYDSDRRLADHFGGKLHLGFQMIREKVKELRVHGFAVLTDSEGWTTWN